MQRRRRQITGSERPVTQQPKTAGRLFSDRWMYRMTDWPSRTRQRTPCISWHSSPIAHCYTSTWIPLLISGFCSAVSLGGVPLGHPPSTALRLRWNASYSHKTEKNHQHSFYTMPSASDFCRWTSPRPLFCLIRCWILTSVLRFVFKRSNTCCDLRIGKEIKLQLKSWLNQLNLTQWWIW